MRSSSHGPSMEGTLKLENMVMQSRTANNADEGSGTGRGTTPGGPNMRTKTWSLYIQMPMLAVEEAANLAAPAVTVVAGLFAMVDEAVSMVLAVKYVPPYRQNMRAAGFEKMNVWGRVRRVRIEDFIEFMRVSRPDAFSMMDLFVTMEGQQEASGAEARGDRSETTYRSIIVTMGATIVPAHAALNASAPNRRPRFFVFHVFSVDSGSRGVGSAWGTGGFMAATRGFDPVNSTALAGASVTAGFGANLSQALSELCVLISCGAPPSWSDVVGSVVNPSASSCP